jgi:ABC-type cobalamin/Fe3+-siderophores transport system ATPase subunit
LIHAYASYRERTLDAPPCLTDVSAGSNGAGKRTIVKATNGLLPMRSGSLNWNGASIASYRLRGASAALLYSDGMKRYSVGILVFMIGVITPFK